MNTLRDDYGWDVALGWGSGNPCPVAAADWPGVICNNGRVSEIQVSCGANKLTTDFPAELNQLTELTVLQITGCWTDPNNPATAKDLTNLSKLNILRLDDNTGLTGTLQDLLGNSMASFPNLLILEISYSGIGGIIPPDMPGSVSTFIHTARVGGTLPNNVQNVFDLFGNQLEGVLPPNWVNDMPFGQRRIDYNKFDVVNTPPGPVDNAQPGWRNTQTVPPTNVQVTPGAANEATLSWTPIGYTWDGGYYEVLASPTPGGPYTSYGTTESTGGKTATGLSVTGLPGGANYFVVRTFTPAHTADSLEVYQAYNDPSSLPFQPYLIPPSPGSSFQDTLRLYRFQRDNPNDLTSVNSAEVSAFICPGNILYVNDDAGGNDDGTSWANAFNDLQEALALAASCPDVTEIWVAEGTYKPTSGTDRNISFSLQNGVAIYGGFPNTGNPTLADRDWAAHETILSGDIGTPGDNSDNSYSVVIGSNTDASAVIDGFTISGGNADVNTGGGVEGANRNGGGMYNNNGSPKVNNCTFSGNSANLRGGGMSNFNYSSPSVTNCIFLGNTAFSRGGGMTNHDFSSSAVTNCTFWGNSADVGGGGMHNTRSSPTITNCIIWGNTGAISNTFLSPIVTHSIIQGGYAPCTDCPGGDGNVDPLFVDAANGDNRLLACSPAIDAGNNAAVPNGITTDLDGTPRFFDSGTVDIGAYEYPFPPQTPIGASHPTAANAGPDQLGCADGVFTLAANTPSVGTGLWSVESGTASISSPGSPNSTVTGIPAGASATLRWTVTNGSCDSFDEVVLTARPATSIVYVNDDAGGNNDGTSWANAFNDLQEALALARNCPNIDQIWVAEGTYKPTSGTDRGISFSMINGVAIYGGFPNTGDPTFADRDWAAHETILSGDIGTPGDNSDNSIHIITNSNLDASAVLDGFTLSGGNANGFSAATQEGAAMSNFQASPTINNCVFRDNFGARNGSCVINATNCSPVFTNCLFTQNTNGGAGDGVIFDFDGGGSLLINCTISGNSTRNAVLGNFFNTNTQVQNCILWDNSNNNFFGDFTISHSIVQGGFGACSNCPGGDGNADPLFVDAANGDLRLRECSPAIDAGDNAANSSSLDLDGNPRVFNATGATTIDIGAYEYQSSYDFTSSCTILYVNDDASGNNDGSSWADAFNDLQDALNQARNNPGIAQIWVAEGTYKPTTGMDRGISFSMVNGVAMYGGFPNTGNPGMAQRDWETNVTTLSGDIDGDNTLANNSLLVMNNSGLNSSTLIDGFTITGGNNENFLGGGMSNNTLCNHTISNCRFVENAAFFGGGMVNSGSSSPLITNCIFSGNSAIAGGVGGGILNLTGCTPSIINSLFSGNSANAGGAIFNDSATPTIINCTFYGNIAILGSAINDNNASSTIMNCILWGNGNEIGNNSSPPSNVINSIIQGGFTPCINCPGGDGDVDPFFVDAPNGDFTLQQCSPAIDAGDNNALPAGIATDLGGNPRFFNNGTVDLGAYEYQATPDPCLCIAERTWTGSVSTDWHTDGNWSPACVPTADNPVIIPDVANDPVISASTAALAQSVHVQSGAVLSIQPMASLTINGSASYTSPMNFTAGLNNEGTVDNSGDLVLGSVSSVGDNGIYNQAVFQNNASGHIRIDRSISNGISNFGTFTNAADITIGAMASVGQVGIFNGSTFQNNSGGHIRIDRSTLEGITNFGTFTNAAEITIGAHESTGLNGLRNNGNFFNNAGGHIRIDRSTNNGLINDFGTFTNAADITIGANESAGTFGLYNRRTFQNTPGGHIQIDRSTSSEIGNFSGGNFTNAGVINLGALGNTGAEGIRNQATFQNDACAQLFMNAPLSNTASFTNAGLFTVTTAGSHINSGLTNDGIIVYPQGNPIPNVTNNDLIVGPVAGCESGLSPALGIGGANSFTAAATWYTDEALSTPAGSYNQSSNTFTSSIGAGTHTLYFSVDGTPGCPRTVPITVNLEGAPTPANAGPDQFGVCGTASLAANTPSVGTGQWSTLVEADGQGSITDPASPTSSFTGTPGQTYTLRWTISNGSSCPSSSDNVDIEFQQPLVSVSVSPLSVDEDEADNLVYTISRDCASAPITVNFSASGTAIFNTDYSQTGAATFDGTTGTVFMDAGVSSVAITFDPVADNTVEPDESITLTLLSGNGYQLSAGMDTATGTILNDDTATLTISNLEQAETDDGTTNFTFQVALDQAVDMPFTVDFATADGTAAVSDGDYVANSGTLSFAGMEMETQFITVAVNGDCLIETDEMFTISLSNLQAGSLDVVFGNTTATGTILNDDLLPSLSCPADFSEVTDLDACSSTIALPVPAISDACGGTTLEFRTRTTDANQAPASDWSGWMPSNSSEQAFNPGHHEIEWRVISGSGTATCSYSLEVRDEQPPTALCQNVTVQLDANGNGSTTAEAVDNGSSDACGVASLSLSQTAFGCAEAGANAETLTVTDVNGNISTCSTTVTVEDNVAPTALCRNVTVQLDANGNGSTSAAAVDNGSNDACGVASLSLSQTAFGCAEAGANAETLTVTDVNGNVSSCSTTVTVEDNVAPTALCQNVTVQLDANGNGSTTAAAVDNGSSDACGVASLSLSQTAFGCAEAGANAETLTVTDVNGNVSTCSTTVTVEDNVAPTALCRNVTVQLDANGNGSTTAAAADNGSSDACGVASLSLSQTSFGCTEAGANAETLTVTDVNGNISTCSTTITVEDNVAPVALCRNVTVQLDANGNGSTSAAAVDNGSSDACGVASLSLSQTAFGCAEAGANAETLTVTDVNGNVSTCSTTVTVEDNVAPVAICQNITVQLDANGNGSTTAAAVDNGSSDACGVASLSLSQTAFGCAEAGANTETLTVTDVNGNISTCSTTVTVEDNIAPVALCRNVTVQLDANGNGSTTAAAADNGSSDACGIASLSLSQTAFGCAEAGANAETLTVTDVNGNVSTCSTTVTVEDNIAPTALCLNTTVNLEPNGTYALKPTDVYNAGASSDNCGIASVSFPPASFTCDQAGAAFPITVTVEDFSGNTDQCIAMVSVEAGTALPAGWAASDIGDQGAGSDYAYDPCARKNPHRGDFTVSTGAYNLIPSNSDNLAFIGRELCNNGGIQARIEDVSGGYAGLMIRESSAPGAKMVAVYSNLTSLLRREIRTTDNGPRASNTSFVPFPYWLRLVRQNDYIRAFYRTSDNGSWTLFHQAYLPMQPCVEMGLAVFTTDPNGQAQATFSQVQWRSNVGGNSLALFNDGAAAPQPEEREASVFPNPARDAFTLAFSKAPESGGTAILRNQVGQVVGQRQLQPGEVATEWDVSSLPSGLYLMEVRQEGWPSQVIRMIKTN
jgi:hypothetical protein